MKDLIIAITGQITKSNFPAFEKEITAKLDEAKAKELITDQDFVDAKETVKFCAKTITAINKVKKQALAETADINELFAGLDRISDSLRETGKTLKEKADADFLKNKNVIVDKGVTLYRAYVDRVVLETPEMLQFVALYPEGFKACIFRKSKLHTVQAAIDKQLKVEINEVEGIWTEVKIKINALAGVMKTHRQLFPDHVELLAKSEQDLLSTISGRVAAYNVEEERKAEALAQEEVAKAKSIAEEVQVADHNEKVKAAEQTPVFDELAVKRDSVPAPGFGEEMSPDTPANQSPDRAAEEKPPVPSPGFVDAPHKFPSTPPPFPEREQVAKPVPVEVETSDAPLEKEEFVITIHLRCDVEWAKRMAGDILKGLNSQDEVENIRLSRP